MIEKIKQKIQKKYYAIILNSKGEQLDIKKLDILKNNFRYQTGHYFYDKAKYNHLELKFKKLSGTYFLYMKGVSEPIPFYNKDFHLSKEKKPYIADDIYSLLQAEQLRKINSVNTGLFSNIEPKKLLIGVGIIIAVIYALSNGVV